MDDLKIARERLERLNRRLVIVRGGRVVAESDSPGMVTTLECLEEVRLEGPGAAMADKIMGRAAAWTAIWAGVSACYGEVLSKSAHALLADHGLSVHASREVADILNRARSGPCPLEEAVAGVQTAQKAVDIIRSMTSDTRD